MFGLAGIAYVYLVYGMYDCLNVVTGGEGDASALLIRAVTPLDGVDIMRRDRVAQTVRRRRGRTDAEAFESAESRRIAALPVARLASGPGLVGAAFGLDRGWTGTDLCDRASPLRLEGGSERPDPARVVATPRIGIRYAGERWASVPWRLSIGGDPSVSGPRPAR